MYVVHVRMYVGACIFVHVCCVYVNICHVCLSSCHSRYYLINSRTLDHILFAFLFLIYFSIINHAILVHTLFHIYIFFIG